MPRPLTLALARTLGLTLTLTLTLTLSPSPSPKPKPKPKPNQAGASSAALDAQGRTPLMRARTARSAGCAHLLAAHAAAVAEVDRRRREAVERLQC